MRALDYPLLADENINFQVIEFLRKGGLDVDSIAEQGKFGLSDAEVLQQATEAESVVLTHDSDFGGLALMGAKFVGIIYLRLVIFAQTLQSKPWKQFEITRPK